MKQYKVERDICPVCRCPADVTLMRRRNGLGVSVTQIPHDVQCSNPRCTNAQVESQSVFS